MRKTVLEAGKAAAFVGEKSAGEAQKRNLNTVDADPAVGT